LPLYFTAQGSIVLMRLLAYILYVSAIKNAMKFFAITAEGKAKEIEEKVHSISLENNML